MIDCLHCIILSLLTIFTLSSFCKVLMFVVLLAGTQNRVDWRLLVEERIAKSEKLINPYLDGFEKKIGF